MSVTTISVTKALTMSVEDFQQLQLAELSELHKLLADSKQKKALRKADLVAGIIKSKLQELKAQKESAGVTEDEPKKELVTAGAENSVKAPQKPVIKRPTAKPTAGATADPLKDELTKPKATATAKPKTKHQIAQELQQLAEESTPPTAPPTAPQEQEQPQEQPKASLKRPTASQPDLASMTQEQLLTYIKQLEEKTERFPTSIEGEKTKYTRIDFEDVPTLQKHLKDKPYSLYCLVDERLDDKLTQFLVLFASPECLVILDRNRHKNSTTTVEMKNVTGTHLKFPKDKQQFEYAFYIREKK